MDATEILTAICMLWMGPAFCVPLIVSCAQRRGRRLPVVFQIHLSHRQQGVGPCAVRVQILAYQFPHTWISIRIMLKE